MSHMGNSAIVLLKWLNGVTSSHSVIDQCFRTPYVTDGPYGHCKADAHAQHTNSKLTPAGSRCQPVLTIDRFAPTSSRSHSQHASLAVATLWKIAHAISQHPDISAWSGVSYTSAASACHTRSSACVYTRLDGCYALCVASDLHLPSLYEHPNLHLTPRYQHIYTPRHLHI